MITQEKKRMVYVGLLVIFCGLIIGSFIDAYVTKNIIDHTHGDYARWWGINGIILLTICGVGAAASWYGDSHKQGREDKVGAVLIFGSALMLVWSGLGDIISAVFQGILFGNGISWFWTGSPYQPNINGWWWCDWTLGGFISKLFGHQHTQFVFMILSSIITILILCYLWYWYLKKA